MSCMLAMADCGSKSQLTTSPKGSLMRTPSWKTDKPCGTPTSGLAVKPRKLMSAWYGLPWAEFTVTLVGLFSRNSERLPWRCLPSSRLP